MTHKRTFLFLEQLILRAGAHENAHNVVSKPEGIDFQFQARNHAVSFIDFLESVVPIR